VRDSGWWYGDEIIAHHDLAPWNLILDDQQWAFIDWDVAGSGTRLWDLAYAMHGFVPLSADPTYQRDDAGHRLRVFADAYFSTERVAIATARAPAGSRPGWHAADRRNRASSRARR
jgi:thiamine kinase-like enzyme